jgi:hypothetical protein
MDGDCARALAVLDLKAGAFVARLRDATAVLPAASARVRLLLARATTAEGKAAVQAEVLTRLFPTHLGAVGHHSLTADPTPLSLAHEDAAAPLICGIKRYRLAQQRTLVWRPPLPPLPPSTGHVAANTIAWMRDATTLAVSIADSGASDAGDNAARRRVHEIMAAVRAGKGAGAAASER